MARSDTLIHILEWKQNTKHQHDIAQLIHDQFLEAIPSLALSWQFTIKAVDIFKKTRQESRYNSAITSRGLCEIFFPVYAQLLLALHFFQEFQSFVLT